MCGWEIKSDIRSDLSSDRICSQTAAAGALQFIHHIRYPWTSDSTRWEPDQHLATASPSAAIIPPPAIHTTQDVGEGEAWLIDIFAPPRIDFSLKPGFVLNEADYPLPSDITLDPDKSGGAMLGWQKSR